MQIQKTDIQTRPTFKTPYDQYKERDGQSFQLLGEILAEGHHDAECSPMYLIRFADGHEIEAWPEEIEAGPPSWL